MDQEQVKQVIEEGISVENGVHVEDGFAEKAAAIKALHDEFKSQQVVEDCPKEVLEVVQFPFTEDDKWALGQNYLEHVLTKEQAFRLNHLRHVMFEAACEVAKYTPKCAQQTLALRQLELAGMWATKAILVTEEK